MTPTTSIRSARPARSRPGFSLVELLVVVAIVMVLAGLLFAVGRASKSQALVSDCTQRLAGVGVALHIYAGDHDDWAPPHAASAGIRWDRGSDAHVDPRPKEWRDSLLPYVGAEEGFMCKGDPFVGTDRDFDGTMIHKYSSFSTYNLGKTENVGDLDGNYRVRLPDFPPTAMYAKGQWAWSDPPAEEQIFWYGEQQPRLYLDGSVKTVSNDYIEPDRKTWFD